MRRVSETFSSLAAAHAGLYSGGARGRVGMADDAAGNHVGGIADAAAHVGDRRGGEAVCFDVG